VWDRNKKAGSEKKRRASSKSSHVITGEAVKGAGALYMEKCAGKEDEVF